MPPVSEAQRKAMFAAAEGKSNLGIPKKVGEEFVGKDAEPKTLYVHRPLVNGAELLAWAKEQGFVVTLPSDDLHATIAFSKTPVDWDALTPRTGNVVVSGGPRSVEALGDKGAVVLRFESDRLDERHQQFGDAGASWDHVGYKPHVTITYEGGAVDLSKVAPFEGPLEFGPEVFGEVNEKWLESVKMVGAEDSFAMDKASVRNYDADGRLHVSSTPISKANICEYYGREIPGAESMGLVPDRKYRLLRHPDELRRGADTFNNLPLLRRHVAVSADDHKPEDVIGSTGSDADFDAPYLTNSLVVWSKDDINDIEREMKKELSSSYRYRADMTSGTYEGEPYDGIMRDIVGNHVALVKEGRAGPDVVVGDEAPQPRKEVKMAPKPLILSTKKAVDAITAFFTPRMAADAKVDGLDKLLLALDESEEDDDKKAKAEDENDLPEPGGEKGKGPAKDKAKDMKAKDRKGRDSMEDLKEKLKGKMSAEDWKAACDDIDGMEAEDEEDDKDDKKGEDEESVTKEDVKSAMDEAIAGERQRQHAIRDAERFVRPWVGDLAIAFDSAEDVYKTALEMRGKATKGIHPSAYRSILEMVPKPGSEHRNSNTRVAMDSASAKGFSDMYPDAMRIGINH